MQSQEYKALSRLLSYPDTWPETWPETKDFPGLPPGAVLAGQVQGGPSELQRLQNLYVSLFINALPEVPCPPYGSVYLEGTVMGESTVAIAQIYEKYGLQSQEMADHIAVELEFLGYLADPLTQSDPEDFRALEDHLLDWAPNFFERVVTHDPEGFYGAVCQRAQAMFASSSGATG